MKKLLISWFLIISLVLCAASCEDGIDQGGSQGAEQGFCALRFSAFLGVYLSESLFCLSASVLTPNMWGLIFEVK